MTMTQTHHLVVDTRIDIPVMKDTRPAISPLRATRATVMIIAGGNTVEGKFRHSHQVIRCQLCQFQFRM